MADELISFENTIAVLRQLAEDVKAGYIEQLTRNDHVTRYGKDRLIDTITAQVTVGEKAFTASLKMNHYWKYLEEGIQPAGKFGNPGWKSFPFILQWVEIKPVIPRPDSNGRIPKPKQLAYLITRKRNEVGDPGTHGFETTREAVLPMYYERIRDAFVKDIGNYLHTVFRW